MSSRGATGMPEKEKKKGKGTKSKSEQEVGVNSQVSVVVTGIEPEPDANNTVPGRSCKSCRGPDAGNMVQCDVCDKWHHFDCVGVTEEVENQSWSCPKCISAKWSQRAESTSNKNLQSTGAISRSNKQLPNPSMDNGTQRNASGIDKDGEGRSGHQGKGQSPKTPSIIKSASSRKSSRTLLKLQMERLEEERRLEHQYLEKKYALLEELASEKSSRSTSSVGSSMGRIRDWVENTGQRIETGSSHPADCEPKRDSTHLQHLSVPLNPDRAAFVHNFRSSVGRTFSVRDIAESRLGEHATAVNFRRNNELPPSSTMLSARSDREDYHAQRSRAEPLNETFNRMLSMEPNVVRVPEGRSFRGDAILDPCPLTTNQIAARQAISKDLPPFSGKPEEWPLFFSSFSSTTAMCGFTDGENAIRLQKCLTGKAYDAVKSLLMYPSNVKRVMATLQMRFGQPEAVVHSLIRKIDQLPILREDKLETIMDFAVEVQNYCSIVDVCGLEDHMYNVSLLHQLVDKLPPSIKLDWARYRQTFTRVNLATFGNWMYTLAEAASTVTIPGTQDMKSTRNEPRPTKKGTGFLNAHLESTENQVQEETSRKTTSLGCLVCANNCSGIDKCKHFRELSRDSRWKVVKEHGLCRRCLRKHYGSCDAKLCGKDGCSFKHHELLHSEQRSRSGATAELSEVQPEQSSIRHDCNTHRSETSAVLFRYLPVIIYGTKGSVKTFAFLDDGSELTLLDHDLVEELGLEGPERPLSLRWTGGTERCEKDSRVTNISIAGVRDGGKHFQLDEVRTVKELQLPHQSLNMNEMKERYPHLRGLPIESYENVRPKILIGMRHLHVSLVLQSREGKLDQPIATKTRLGWTVCGASCETNASSLVHYSFHVGENNTSDESLHQSMKEYFSLDSMGVTKTEQTLLSTDDRRACLLLDSLTTCIGNRYETGLLWRSDNCRLPDSRPMALRRFHLLEKRMQKNPELAVAIDQKIADYLTKGYIRKVQDEERKPAATRVWYLPVFPVVNPNKPGKIRIVWDAAASVFGISLNSALLKGPDQLCSLLSILLQFRTDKIGLTGDIREMYHQVYIREQDRPCQRFFWRDAAGCLAVYEMCVMTFGACCSPSSAQYVKNKNAEKFASDYPEAAEVITKKHYVDDMLLSVASEEEAIQIAKDVRFVHSQGGFEIRNWISNSRAVVMALGESEATTKSLNLSTELSTEKVLGLWWCTESDTLTFKVGWTRYDEDLLDGRRRPTKRELLRFLMSIFDPLGLIAHFLIYLKMLLQEIWRAGLQWDEPISEDLFVKWKTWLRILPDVEKIKIPRCYHTHSFSGCDAQLHTFVDASENGFAAVSFVRFKTGDLIECAIIAAKTRVAPLRFQSIPRLELQAGVLGVRLARTITEAIQLQQRFFWTDSQDVLCWINSDHRRYTQFVAHRISEILEATETTDWRWVPTKLNVADDGTKWGVSPDMTSRSRWFIGPEFLWREESEWPRQPSLSITTKEELRPSLIGHQSVASGALITYEDFSSWRRLTYVVGFIYRFVNKCLRRTPRHTQLGSCLIMEEIRAAEEYVLRETQLKAFTEEMEALIKQKPLPRTSSLLSYNPWLDEHGLIRMRGRTSRCLFATEEAKNPIILPRDHHVTKLILDHYHNKFHHLNHETAVNEIRQKYWVPQIRVCYAKIRRGCQRCKNERATPCPPKMADLPFGRLAAFARPFTHVGIDYFGPMEVALGRRIEKRWGMLATCMTTRAVHIEIAHSLNTESCIMAIRNMISRRGVPRQIYCDRGTNFVGSCRELGRIAAEMNHETIMKEFVSSETSWSFNPPSSPHMGGSWERLIRSVKTNLMALNLPRRPSDEVLRNALTEIENTLNARPLTHVSIDDPASPALTPNHILLGSSNGVKPLTVMNDPEKVVRQCWRSSQVIANHFWKRWLRDYLPEITRRTKWHTRSAVPIQVDDVVIIVDPNLPRNCWPKGRVVATRASKDGEIRSATVRTSGGLYERPVVKLAVLDVVREEE